MSKRTLQLPQNTFARVPSLIFGYGGSIRVHHIGPLSVGSPRSSEFLQLWPGLKKASNGAEQDTGFAPNHTRSRAVRDRARLARRPGAGALGPFLGHQIPKAPCAIDAAPLTRQTIPICYKFTNESQRGAYPPTVAHLCDWSANMACMECLGNGS